MVSASRGPEPVDSEGIVSGSEAHPYTRLATCNDCQFGMLMLVLPSFALLPVFLQVHCMVTIILLLQCSMFICACVHSPQLECEVEDSLLQSGLSFHDVHPGS